MYHLSVESFRFENVGFEMTTIIVVWNEEFERERDRETNDAIDRRNEVSLWKGSQM